jgi:hypothetical protein
MRVGAAAATGKQWFDANPALRSSAATPRLRYRDIAGVDMFHVKQSSRPTHDARPELHRCNSANRRG